MFKWQSLYLGSSWIPLVLGTYLIVGKYHICLQHLHHSPGTHHLCNFTRLSVTGNVGSAKCKMNIIDTLLYVQVSGVFNRTRNPRR